ncbi:MAG TPA: type VI secretion system baseplate subunit TssK [Chthoniobacterales bacterium]
MQLHWHEGLFLLPHHLQRMQRSAQEAVWAERRLAWPYPYGLVEARLSQDDLENLRLRFDHLRAVMPGGQEVSFPQDAELPVIDLKKAFETRGRFVVYLGVPLYFPTRANAMGGGNGADFRAKILYRVAETEVTDENTGENLRPLQYRRVNARLLLEDEDRSDLDTIPLLRVVRATGEELGLPHRDPEFVGPCLVMSGSPTLRELVRELSSQVLASRRELEVQVSRGGFSIDTMRGLQFEQIMRLRTLNRFGARLEALAEVPAVAPFDLYLELRELLGELAALHPDRSLFECTPYQHDSPYVCFEEVCAKIRQLLRGSVAPSFLKVPFVQDGPTHRALLTDEHLTRPTDYFLAVRTREDPRSVARLVEDADRFKLMPESMAGRAIRGVVLKEERFPPLELPAQSGLYYYRLQRGESARSWQQVQAEKRLVVRWTGHETADYDLTLYMVLPRTDNPAGKDG